MDNDIIEKRKMLFSQRLKKALEELNVTQTELCKRTDIPKSAMSQYVSGNFQPKQDRLYKIADSLNISPAWLMGYEVPMSLPKEDGFRMHKNLHGGFPYLSWMEKDLVEDYVKKEQAKEKVEIIPFLNIDDVNNATLDPNFNRNIEYAPLIIEEKPGKEFIYVIFNSKYDDYKDKMYPLIEENDIVLLDFGAEPQNGDLAMIEFVPGKNFFCRYFDFSDRLEFRFDSSKAIVVSSDDKDFERYAVRGVVKQVIKNIK